MIAPARRIAYRLLLQIETGDAHSDELLRTPRVDALSEQDRNLATMLVLGTLRWQLALDTRIRPLLARPDAKLSPEASTALRLGAFQLLHLERVPAHAVVHDAVELVQKTPERGAAGMVNAVLRKIAGQPRWQIPAILNSAADLAAACAHPRWMTERWTRHYGQLAAEQICRWDQQPAGIALRIVDPAADLSGFELDPGAFLAGTRRLLRGDVGRSEALRTGQIRIQDEASQLVAEIAAAAVPRASAVLDTCAAPGGKTAVLAERLPKAAITAVDASRRRLNSMREKFSQWQSRLHFHVADAASLHLKPEFDLILCDVPCSGTGTMARNPEIRLRIEEPELKRQHERQVAILSAALPGLAPGGRLVYSTCSLEPEENEAVIEAVRRSSAGLKVLPLASILDSLVEAGVVTSAGRELLRAAEDGPFLRTLPGRQPCDGFFAAILEKT
jgi:16S rRNA (cytosine967-C5)-methyltransferase